MKRQVALKGRVLLKKFLILLKFEGVSMVKLTEKLILLITDDRVVQSKTLFRIVESCDRV
jgi:hypothetical protein